MEGVGVALPVQVRAAGPPGCVRPACCTGHGLSVRVRPVPTQLQDLFDASEQVPCASGPSEKVRTQSRRPRAAAAQCHALPPSRS